MTDRPCGGFWRRLFAYAVDKIILYCIALFLLLIAIAALVLGGFSADRIIAGGNPLQGIGPVLILYLGTLFLIDMLYFTWFHGSVGQTPGKMLLKLRVIQASGEEMTFGVAFLRWAATYVSSLFLSLGYLWIALDGKKQGWHDKIAATLVVRTAGEPQQGPPPLAVHPAETAPCPPAADAPGPSVFAPAPDIDGGPGTVAAPGSDTTAPPPEPAPPAEAGTGAA